MEPLTAQRAYDKILKGHYQKTVGGFVLALFQSGTESGVMCMETIQLILLLLFLISLTEVIKYIKK